MRASATACALTTPPSCTYLGLFLPAERFPHNLTRSWTGRRALSTAARSIRRASLQSAGGSRVVVPFGDRALYSARSLSCSRHAKPRRGKEQAIWERQNGRISTLASPPKSSLRSGGAQSAKEGRRRDCVRIKGYRDQDRCHGPWSLQPDRVLPGGHIHFGQPVPDYGSRRCV